MTDRLTTISEREFELAIEQAVECEFEARLASGVTKLPWIDGALDPEQQAEQKQRVIRALLARRWFEREEAPPWAVPLPLNEQERGQLYMTGSPQLAVLASYAGMLWGMHWHFERAPSFFDYIQQSAPR